LTTWWVTALPRSPLGIDEILGEKREEVLRIAAKHGVISIRVFGSVARGESLPTLGTFSDATSTSSKNALCARASVRTFSLRRFRFES
jgi:hypothetical protein